MGCRGQLSGWGQAGMASRVVSHTSCGPWAQPQRLGPDLYFPLRSGAQPRLWACVPMEAVGDPHTVTVSMDSSEISMIINSIKEECFRSGVAEAPGGSKAPSIDGKEDLDLCQSSVFHPACHFAEKLCDFPRKVPFSGHPPEFVYAVESML